MDDSGVGYGHDDGDGPGQHELMHLVASGLSKNKFNVLAPQFTEVFFEWRDAIADAEMDFGP